MPALHPQPAAPAPTQLNAKLNPLDLGGRNLRLKLRNRPSSRSLPHRGGREGSGTCTTSSTCCRDRRGQRRQYFWPLFRPGFWGWVLGLAAREVGRLSFAGAQSGECSKTMILICVDQSEVKTVERTDIDPPELNPVTVWHHPNSNIL